MLKTWSALHTTSVRRPEGLDVGRHPQQQVAVAVGEAALGRGTGAGLRDDPAEAAAVAVQAPRATAGEVVVDRGHLVLQRHPHVGQVGVHEPREGEVDQPVHPAVRQRGLGPLAREHVHPGPLAPGLHQGQHLTASWHGRSMRTPKGAGVPTPSGRSCGDVEGPARRATLRSSSPASRSASSVLASALVPVGPASARQERARDLPAFTDVSTTWGTSCAAADGGRVWCWGSNGSGALGPDGVDGTVPRPQRIDGRWRQFSNADGVSCGVRGRGRGYCWGRNELGQIARPISGYSQPRPQRVAGRWREIVTSGSTTCGIRTSGASCAGGTTTTSRQAGSTACYALEPHLVGRGFVSVAPGTTVVRHQARRRPGGAGGGTSTTSWPTATTPTPATRSASAGAGAASTWARRRRAAYARAAARLLGREHQRPGPPGAPERRRGRQHLARPVARGERQRLGVLRHHHPRSRSVLGLGRKRHRRERRACAGCWASTGSPDVGG